MSQATHPDTLRTAVRLIESEEGVETQAYLDIVGVPTICAGLTRYPDGTIVRMGDVCHPAICRKHLEVMLKKDYLPQLEKIPGWKNFGPNRQAVLMSFAWNLTSRGSFFGAKDFETITGVLRDGVEDPGRYDDMPAALMLYVNAGGQYSEGLANRRKREGDLWMTESGRAPGGVISFKARQDTFIKKAPIDSKYLSALGAKPMAKGEVIKVARLTEIPADSHAWAELNYGQGRWALFLPHWERVAEISPPKPQVDWTDFSASAGKYITVGEVLQYDARRQPKRGSKEEAEILNICQEFDRIRAAWGAPIGVTSGYRPEPINRQVGGVANSTHVQGKALDVYPVGGDLDNFYRWLSKRWSGGLGDGRKRGFVHLDTRNNGRFCPDANCTPAANWDY